MRRMREQRAKRGAITNTALTTTRERKQHQPTSQGAAVAAARVGGTESPAPPPAGRCNRQNSAGVLSLAGSAAAFAASIVIAVLIACMSLAGLVLGREGLYVSDITLADGIITSTAGT